MAALLTDRAALPQIRLEALIGSQENYEIKITIYFYKIMISTILDDIL